MGDLTDNFSKKEFRCRCGCGFDAVSLQLVRMLEASRQATGLVYRIVSGCRCHKHNEASGGMFDSDHVTGEGADIQCLNSAARYVMLKDFLQRFTRVGVGKSFIHVGINQKNLQNVLWLY